MARGQGHMHRTFSSGNTIRTELVDVHSTGTAKRYKEGHHNSLLRHSYDCLKHLHHSAHPSAA